MTDKNTGPKPGRTRRHGGDHVKFEVHRHRTQPSTGGRGGGSVSAVENSQNEGIYVRKITVKHSYDSHFKRSSVHDLVASSRKKAGEK